MAVDDAHAYRGRVFLTLLVVGLVGLVAMAIPAFGHSHGALSGHSAHGGVGHPATGHGGGIAHASSTSLASNPRGAIQHLLPADAAHASGWGVLPSPRAVFSVLALYGAFGNAALHAFHLSLPLAAVAAALPALLVERLLVRPVWNLVFRLEARACSPLEALVLNEAEAVTAFRNGRGLISTVRDGRRVQLMASLRADQSTLRVPVGCRLLVEDVGRCQ